MNCEKVRLWDEKGYGTKKGYGRDGLWGREEAMRKDGGIDRTGRVGKMELGERV